MLSTSRSPTFSPLYQRACRRDDRQVWSWHCRTCRCTRSGGMNRSIGAIRDILSFIVFLFLSFPFFFFVNNKTQKDENISTSATLTNPFGLFLVFGSQITSLSLPLPTFFFCFPLFVCLMTVLGSQACWWIKLVYCKGLVLCVPASDVVWNKMTCVTYHLWLVLSQACT